MKPKAVVKVKGHKYHAMDSDGLKFQSYDETYLNDPKRTAAKIHPKAVKWMDEVLLPRARTLADPPRILDMGCRTGYYMDVFKRKGCEVEGIDCIREYVDFINHRSKKAVLGDCAYCHEYFPENYFDGVFASHVLEHLSNPKVAMTNLRKVVKLGAPCLIIGPRYGRGPTFTTMPPEDLGKHRTGFGSSDSFLSILDKDLWKMEDCIEIIGGWRVVLCAI